MPTVLPVTASPLKEAEPLELNVPSVEHSLERPNSILQASLLQERHVTEGVDI